MWQHAFSATERKNKMVQGMAILYQNIQNATRTTDSGTRKSTQKHYTEIETGEQQMTPLFTTNKKSVQGH
jgi:hypothetical protein